MTARHRLLRLAGLARAQRSGELNHDLAVFTDLLRTIGVGVSTGASLQALRALTFVRLEAAGDFRSALECCLTSNVEDRARFATVYDTFWSAGEPGLPAVRGEEEAAGGGGAVRGTGDRPGPTTAPAARGRPDRAGLAGLATYGRTPGRSQPVAVPHRPEIDDLSRRLARALRTAPGRRLVSEANGEAIDLRTSLRHNLRFGEELVLLQHTTRRRDRPRIVVLCDVSSSMQPFIPLFLAFVHSLTHLVRRVESAIFNVELVMVSDVFRRTTLNQALTWLSRRQVALSGGTRIGHCLHGFVDNLERRAVIRPATVALILSDGWDVGDADLLRDGMRRLRSQAGRVLWCDPHAAATGYQPQVQGLRVALSYVDDYLDFSTAASLSNLVTQLEQPARTPRNHHRLDRDCA